MMRCLLLALLVAGCSKEHRLDALDVNTGCHASCEWCVDLQVYCAKRVQAEDKHKKKEMDSLMRDQ